VIEQQTVIYMSKLKIQHNFLDTNVFDTFFKSIKDESFPWFRGYKVEDDKKQIQLRHVFLHPEYGASPYYDIVKPILINFDNVVKVKLNLTFSSGTQDIGGWHYDYDKTTNIKIAVLYLNTNNGYTKLNDGTQILSEKNKLAVFDNVNHTDVTQTDTTERFVLNIGYIDD